MWEELSSYKIIELLNIGVGKVIEEEIMIEGGEMICLRL